MPPGESTRFVTLVANFRYKRQIATVMVDFVLIALAYYSAYAGARLRGQPPLRPFDVPVKRASLQLE